MKKIKLLLFASVALIIILRPGIESDRITNGPHSTYQGTVSTTPAQLYRGNSHLTKLAGQSVINEVMANRPSCLTTVVPTSLVDLRPSILEVSTITGPLKDDSLMLHCDAFPDQYFEDTPPANEEGDLMEETVEDVLGFNSKA